MPLKMYSDSEQKTPSKKLNIIGIAAGKGGVGKSSVTANLALALKTLGYSVGVIDADIYGPSLRKMLPEETLPRQEGQTLYPARSSGIELISMAYFRRENEAAVVRAPIANNIIQQFLKQVAWGDLDYLLIDFPPGTGDVQLTLCQQANLTGALIVTTPQEVALLDVRKAIYMLEQVKVPILGIVENMSYYYHAKTGEKLYLFGEGGGARLADEFQVPFLGGIPIDPELCRCGDVGQSIFAKDIEGKSPSAKAFLALGRSLAGCVSATRSNPTLVSRVLQKDLHHFTVEWSDGQASDYRLSDLQKQCPCARCVDEVTGKRLSDASAIDPQVGAKSIASVGRYALKVEFTSGCSTGLYSFEMLREMAGL
jgi:ATP-binding protein involved in chromosome partitioning